MHGVGHRAGQHVGGVSFRNMGAYAQGAYAVTDPLKTAAGVRYTDDKSSGFVMSRNWSFVGAPGTFVAPSNPHLRPRLEHAELRVLREHPFAQADLDAEPGPRRPLHRRRTHCF